MRITEGGGVFSIIRTGGTWGVVGGKFGLGVIIVWEWGDRGRERHRWFFGMNSVIVKGHTHMYLLIHVRCHEL